MARIPDEVVERLKREVSLEGLARAAGVELKRQGESWIGLCPFHDDRSPSFVVTPSKNLWHCLGACQAGGSVIDFVMRRERCSYRAAPEMLLRDAPSLAAPVGARAPSTSAKLTPLVEAEESDAVVLGRVAELYHVRLRDSTAGITYTRVACSQRRSRWRRRFALRSGWPERGRWRCRLRSSCRKLHWTKPAPS